MTNKLPQGWVECEFGKIFEVVNGDRGKNYPAKNKLQTAGIPFVSAVNIQDGKLREDNLLCLTDEQYNLLNNGKINTEDTLLCIRGSIGKHCRYFKEKGAIASSMVIIRRNQFEVLNSLLHYYLDSHIMKAEIKKYDNGTAQPNLSAADLRKFYFPLPPLNEQKRIVEKIEEEFGKIDEGIEKLKLAQEQIKQYRQSVLKSAFDGKLYKTTEWEEKKLEEILANDQYSMKRGPFGSSLKKAYFVPKGIRVFEQYNPINNDPYWSRYYISDSKYEELKAFTAQAGDLLISCSGTLGKIIELPKDVEKGIINQALLKITLNPEKIINQFFIYLFRSPIMQKKIFDNTIGTAIQNIASVKELKKIKILLPTPDEQKQIVREIEKRFEVADEVERVITENLAKAEQLKQSILKKAFEGRLVPQDPTDQPASELLAQIQKERKK